MRARNINSIDLLTPDDILDKRTLSSILEDDGIQENLVMEYALEDGMDYMELEDDEEFLESEEFKNFCEYELKFRAENTLDFFKNEVINHDNTIDIWREMTVPDNYLSHLNKEGKHLGIWWSWDPKAAEAHWGHNKPNYKVVLIQSRIDINYINWKPTIIANFHPMYLEEKEIQLYKNTPLEILRMTIDDNDITSKLVTKIFYS